MNKSRLLISESGNTTNKNNNSYPTNRSKNESTDTIQESNSNNSNNNKYVRPKSLNYANCTLASKEQLIYSNRNKFAKQTSIPNSTLTTNTAANHNANTTDTSSSIKQKYKYQQSGNESFSSKLCAIDKNSELECKKKNANLKEQLKQVKKAKTKQQKNRNNEKIIDEEDLEEATIKNNTGVDDDDDESSEDEDDNEDDTESLLYPAYVPVALKYISLLKFNLKRSFLISKT